MQVLPFHLAERQAARKAVRASTTLSAPFCTTTLGALELRNCEGRMLRVEDLNACCSDGSATNITPRSTSVHLFDAGQVDCLYGIRDGLLHLGTHSVRFDEVFMWHCNCRMKRVGAADEHCASAGLALSAAACPSAPEEIG